MKKVFSEIPSLPLPTGRLGSMCRGILFAFGWAVLCLSSASAQEVSELRFGGKVPPEVNRIYERGLNYLVQSQSSSGGWGKSHYRNGVTALGVMAILSSGEDPNFGRYSTTLHRALRQLIKTQNSKTGYFESSMYDHGFCMLALSEAYGAVDDRVLWQKATAGKEEESSTNAPRTIGKALELAVKCALTSQNQNPHGAWRYSPSATDADTSVAGAVLVGLLAARNAGIEIPDENIEDALEYFAVMTSPEGSVGYSGLGSWGQSLARSSIANLVFSIGKQKDWEEHKLTLGHIKKNINSKTSSHWSQEYSNYYLAQALFQSDFEAWQEWNSEMIDHLSKNQKDNGSFDFGSHGVAYSTSMSLLALALNYRFLPIYER